MQIKLIFIRAPGLIMKKRLKVIRKWPIGQCKGQPSRSHLLDLQNYVSSNTLTTRQLHQGQTLSLFKTIFYFIDDQILSTILRNTWDQGSKMMVLVEYVVTEMSVMFWWLSYFKSNNNNNIMIIMYHCNRCFTGIKVFNDLKSVLL